jgi:hypothetical protein
MAHFSDVEKRNAKLIAKWLEEKGVETENKLRRDRAIAAACEGVADPQPGELLRLRQELAKIKGGA